MNTTLAKQADAGDGPVSRLGPQTPSLADRLKAWWEGYHLVTPEKMREKKSRAVQPPPPSPADKPPKTLWNTERAQAAELIWGEGFIWPGSKEYFLDLVKPFALTPAMSVLDISAGLGGGTRALASTFGLWVDGLEASSELAAAAMEKSHMAGLSKKAPVRAYDPENPDLQRNKFDCVVSREAFYMVNNKEPLFKAIEQALKDKGQIMFTDYVFRPAKFETEAMKRWRGSEPSRIWPWTSDDYVTLTTNLGLEMRICEDTTQMFRNHIMTGWSRFMDLLKGRRIELAMMLAVVEEAELWATRVKALDSGDVHLYRFHLLKKKPNLMSDW